MKVKITRPVVLEALEGSIVEINERQFKLIKDYCKLETEQEPKKTRKAKK